MPSLSWRLFLGSSAPASGVSVCACARVYGSCCLLSIWRCCVWCGILAGTVGGVCVARGRGLRGGCSSAAPVSLTTRTLRLHTYTRLPHRYPYTGGRGRSILYFTYPSDRLSEADEEEEDVLAQAGPSYGT